MTSSDKTRSSKQAASKSNLAVVEVPFHDHSIVAVQDGNVVRVPIAPMCAILGVDKSSQLARLKKTDWATVVFITTVGADGRKREMATLDLDSVMMWLATIEPSRVDPKCRDSLALLQKECARVLRDYFFAGGAINPRATEEQLASLIAKIEQQTATVHQLESRLHVQNDQIARLTWMVENDNGLAVFVWHLRNVRRVEKIPVRGAAKLFDVPDAKIAFLPKGKQESIAERVARASDFVRRAYMGTSTTREGITRDAFKEKVFETIARAGFPVMPYDLSGNLKKEPVDVFDMVNTLKLEGRIVANAEGRVIVALPIDIDRVKSPLEYCKHFFTVEKL